MSLIPPRETHTLQHHTLTFRAHTHHDARRIPSATRARVRPRMPIFVRGGVSARWRFYCCGCFVAMVPLLMTMLILMLRIRHPPLISLLLLHLHLHLTTCTCICICIGLRVRVCI